MLTIGSSVKFLHPPTLAGGGVEPVCKGGQQHLPSEFCTALWQSNATHTRTGLKSSQVQTLDRGCQTMSSDVGRCVFLSSSLGSHARGRRRSLAQRSNAASATILTDRTVGRVAVRAVIGRSHVSQPGSKNPCACQARCIHSAPFGPRLLYTDPLTASIFCKTTFSRARCLFFVPRVALYFLPIHASHNPSDSQQHPNPISHTDCMNDAKLVIMASYMRLLRAPICVLASPSGKLPSRSPAKVR